jgi:hypothetical protein
MSCCRAPGRKDEIAKVRRVRRCSRLPEPRGGRIIDVPAKRQLRLADPPAGCAGACSSAPPRSRRSAAPHRANNTKQLDDNLDAQAAAVREDDMVRLDDLDEAFHATIFRAVNSPRAQRLLDATRAILDRSRFHALPEPGRPKATVAEHRRIVDAIRSGDVELASAAMRVHLTVVAQALERDLARMEIENAPAQTR